MNKFFVFFIAVASLLGAELSYTKVLIDQYTNAHILVVDPSKYEMISKKALQKNGVCRDTVVSFVDDSKALAGINGGFWKLNGDPAGILKCDGIFIGQAAKLRGAIGWKEGGKVVYIDRLLTKKEEGVIYVLPQSNYTKKDHWQDLDHIVGGALVLIRDREIITDHSCEKTIESFRLNKHARTAVGIRDNGDWVFVVIEQYQKGLGGMTIAELSNFIYGLELKDAVNLDGGSSSKMVIGGEIMNPSVIDKPVSDAILIFERKLLD
jgi:exopolysaccharide biosynthesis protein